MESQSHCKIQISNVGLDYLLYHDRTSSLKEWVINAIHRRSYVQNKTSQFSALDGINIDINEGDRLGIIGLNGSGKSTLLKVISGILKPTRGQVTVRGSIQPLIEIGAGFNPEFSGRENIYLNGYMLGFTKNEIRAREEEIIEFAELREFIDTPIKYYSSGMAVRLAFTIATIVRPEILVFDEMLSAGDLKFIDKAKKRLNELLKSAKILVLVTHDLGLAKSLCTKGIVLANGRLTFAGDITEAINYYRSSVRED